MIVRDSYQAYRANSIRMTQAIDFSQIVIRKSTNTVDWRLTPSHSTHQKGNLDPWFSYMPTRWLIPFLSQWGQHGRTPCSSTLLRNVRTFLYRNSHLLRLASLLTALTSIHVSKHTPIHLKTFGRSFKLQGYSWFHFECCRYSHRITALLLIGLSLLIVLHKGSGTPSAYQIGQYY
jgi:hypothetical protein